MKPKLLWNGYRWMCFAGCMELRRTYIGFGATIFEAWDNMMRRV